jgi:hypothetical protein
MLPPIALFIVRISSTRIYPITAWSRFYLTLDEIAAWIDLVERKLSSNSNPSNMHHQPTTVSMT